MESKKLMRFFKQSVTEIAILKDLDEKNKVKDDGVKSRIIHTEKKDPHMSQYKDVKEQ